jgi:hypothetical protein
MPDVTSTTAFLLQLKEADLVALPSRDIRVLAAALQYAQTLCDNALNQDADTQTKRARLETTELSLDHVKLNLRGSIFFASRDVLCNEPDTFFTALLSGRWELKLDDVQAVVIDRSPQVFPLVLDYLTGDDIGLKNMQKSQRARLLAEANFYQISSLVRQLAPFPEGPNWVLSEDGATFTVRAFANFELDEVNFLVPLLAPTTNWCSELKFRINSGWQYLYIDIRQGPEAKSLGWFYPDGSFHLYDVNGDGVDFDGLPECKDGSEITIRRFVNSDRFVILFDGENVTADIWTEPDEDFAAHPCTLLNSGPIRVCFSAFDNDNESLPSVTWIRS